MENKTCQSCGMPITSNEQLSTNKDGNVLVQIDITTSHKCKNKW